MPNPRINGTLQPVRQPIKVQYSPSQGLQVEVPWESAGDNLQGLAAAYQSLRVAYELHPNAAKSRLVATASGGQLGVPDLTTDTWEILGNEIQYNVTENPKCRGTLSLKALTAINKAVSDNLTIDEARGRFLSEASGDNQTVMNNYFALIAGGSTHYSAGQYVLKHTTNVSNQYSVNVSDINVEKIYTFPQLLAEATNLTSWIYPLPGRMQFKLQQIGSSPPAAAANYLFGWRKLPATETTSAGDRISISSEYWLAQWSLLLYDSAS